MIVTGKEVVSWVAKRTNEYGNFGSETGIGWATDRLKAGVVYADWNGVNVVCHIAAEVFTRQYLFVIFDYPFNQLNVKRITVCVGEGNKKSRRFVEHLGFELETTLKSAHPTGDLLVYVMWKKDCRWISQDFEKHYAKAA